MISKRVRAKRGKVKRREVPEPVTASLGDYGRIMGSCNGDAPRRSTRSNTASVLSRDGEYANLYTGAIPYSPGRGGGKYTSNVSLEDTIMLCQKAYWNVPVFRN